MFQRIFFCVLIAAPVCSVAQQSPRFPREQGQQDVYQRLRQLEAQVRDLRADYTVQQAAFGGVPVCPDCFNDQPDCVCGSKWDAQAYVELRLTGFFQLDSGWYGQDTNNRNTLGDIEDGLGFRRARLAAAGKVAERTSFIMEFDFAQAQARFVDVWMQFEDTPAGNIRIGRYRQPFGMSELTSIRELPFLERPVTFALAPFRQTGIMFSDTAWNERVTWAVSGYRFLSDNFGNVYSDTGGYGMATRVTFLPAFVSDCNAAYVGYTVCKQCAIARLAWLLVAGAAANTSIAPARSNGESSLSREASKTAGDELQQRVS